MYYTEKCKGAYIRSRATWIEKGEKSTSYFYILEKKHQSNNTINQIRDENITVHTDNDNIIKCLYTFYNSLYRYSLSNVNDRRTGKL